MSNLRNLPRAKLKSLSLEQRNIQVAMLLELPPNRKQASMQEARDRYADHNRFLLALLEKNFFSRTVTVVDCKKYSAFNKASSCMLRTPEQ